MSYPQSPKLLWTAYEAAAATGGTLLSGGSGRHEDGRAGADNWVASGISFDTRSLAPGDLFVAIKGARDGHEFLSVAAEKVPLPRWSRTCLPTRRTTCRSSRWLTRLKASRRSALPPGNGISVISWR